MAQIFRLPDVGEGLTEAEVVTWKVRVGDEVVVDQPLVEIETAKSLVELPSPWEGAVLELLAQEGETLEVGAGLVSIGDSAEAPGSRPDPGYSGTGAEARAASEPEAPAPSSDAGSGEEPEQKPLVGSGPKADPVVRRQRSRRPARQEPASPEAPAQQTEPSRGRGAAEPAGGRSSLGDGIADLLSRAGLGQGTGSRGDRLARLAGGGSRDSAGTPAGTGGAAQPARASQPALAKPPVRKAAKEMGIDLREVSGTGEAGQVTKRDLLAYAAHLREVPEGPDGFWVSSDAPGAGDRTQRIPVKGVRKLTAQNMVKSAFTAPHVSIFVDVDATRTMEFVKRLKTSDHFEGVKVTPLLLLARAVIWAAARNPQVNATWTDREIVIKRYMNLGIAAATPRGLMVPNIKDAQDMSLRELAIALNELTATARAGRTQPGDMQNGTLSITNIGSLGIDIGTPIINPGEVAIVAFGTIKQKPWVVDGEIIPRWITTLGGSFDHRVVDGDLSARFMADVASILEEPALLLD
ncbi:2-oxo acid dehydrogenase subunit E2 [Kocuria sp. p3-SID1433]|uniref:dihydrolipoamide acetyltransferase family protein n=1 Tax=unclassified Kocuria TaxID=2649579 RepID=UPI0021A5C073|nr:MULTISPECIES: 2-oxo acid dehydrogenase subunit E2 [unclassified Kocuria]MCT1602583.1 2-oxo acid dehydrogenase subunit E2 [Kocuria sp. p3-SID1428]MCT2180712.1 2-oxo acid dehydrogenase subunit E2 [Kocuria sp. p3-SID1433]